MNSEQDYQARPDLAYTFAVHGYPGARYALEQSTHLFIISFRSIANP